MQKHPNLPVLMIVLLCSLTECMAFADNEFAQPLESSPDISAETSAQQLAQRILSGTLQDATEAVSEAYALAGVATHSLESGLVRPAIAPTIPVNHYTFEVSNLAIDAQRRATGGWSLTLAELGNTLQELGWQPPSQRDLGTVLRDVLARDSDGSARTHEPP